MKEYIPSKTDIAPSGKNPDELTAAENFLGMSCKQVLYDLCAGDMGGYAHTEDLLWMGEKAFLYYLPAFIDYLRSEFSRGDADTADGFVFNVYHRLTGESSVTLPPDLRDQLAACMQHILTQPGKWELDDDVDDTYAKQACEILSIIHMQ